MAWLNRRRFLLAASTTATALGSAAMTTSMAGAAESRAVPAQRPEGTTLRTAAAADIGEGYRRLTAGPGWQSVLRTDLIGADPGREERRSPVSAFAQFTDLHIIDAQSPLRFEYLHQLLAGAHRPHETLGAVATTRLIERVNRMTRSPVTGQPMSFVISTGDNTDNHEQAELDWYMALLNGGRMAQNTGAARYEGVQDSGDPLYWHPDGDVDDQFRARGFPSVPGLLDDAVRPFDSPGLRLPWYATVGNHDNAVMGTLPENLLPNQVEHYTGSRKIIGRNERESRRMATLLRDPRRNTVQDGSVDLDNGIVREVTPDERRAPFSVQDFIAVHVEPSNTGPGPVGHGFDPGGVEANRAYYTFPVAAGVTGISLDTTNTAGFADGSLGLAQYQWLERTLTAASSRFYDRSDQPQQHAVTDELFLIFSHHTSDTMNALLPDARRPDEPRVSGSALADLLQRFPNVLAWINGHSHRNEIRAHSAEDDPACGFWEINTASHVDFPQLARIIELADNRDGTVSIHTTLIEADSPYRAGYEDRSSAGLASLYRELAFNDPNADLSTLGEPSDRNAELLVPGRMPTR